MTKYCPRCKTDVDIAQFSKNARKADGLQGYCKTCMNAVGKRYYTENHNQRKEKVRQRSEAHLVGLHALVWDHLVDHPCVDCGEADPVVLEFDHVRGKKIKSVSDMIRLCMATITVSAEIAKCDVRCANCHRRKTARDIGSWRHSRLV